MRFFKRKWKKTFHGQNGPYLTVYTLVDIQARGHRVSLCLHNFHRGDEDPDCHDHPFHFFSFLLRGRYREHAEDLSFKDRGRLSLAYRPATHRHRVELLAPAVWTLCLKIDAHREWGFWRQGKFIPWRDYIKAKGLTPIGEYDFELSLARLLASSPRPSEPGEWVTVGKITVDIDNETETFERVEIEMKPGTLEPTGRVREG